MTGKKERFVVFEGTDGSGKATQVGLLRDKLREEGFVVACYAFPQYDDNFYGRFLDDLLHGRLGSIENAHPYTMSFAYMMDRKAAAPRIDEDLAKGKIVLADRFTSSNMGHQGGKFASDTELVDYLNWLEEMEYHEEGIPRPDQIIYLALAPEVSHRLMLQRAEKENREIDDVEGDLDYRVNSAEGFMKVAAMKGWDVVDCNDYDNESILPPETIADMVWEFVEPKLVR